MTCRRPAEVLEALSQRGANRRGERYLATQVRKEKRDRKVVGNREFLGEKERNKPYPVVAALPPRHGS